MSKAPQVVTIDFETEGIEARPKYPPKPCSVGIKWPGESQYRIMAWAHPSGNNCTEKEARGELKRAYESKYPVLAQNFSFDGDVAEVHWDLKLPAWDQYHELMFALFLWDPHSPSLALKPCAERYLGIKPEERDLMNDWIIANIPEAARKPSTAGAYISRVPFKIVAPYLRGDLIRTLGLFNMLYPLVVDAGMGPAYDRERMLMPVLLENERIGMRVDVAGLDRDLPAMQEGLEKADSWLRKQLGDINIGSDQQLADALLSKGIVHDLARTPKGRLSVSKKTLTLDKFKDKRVFQALSYRSKMSTCVSMFIEPWRSLAAADGVIHPNWSQVRAPKGGGDDTNGARSGRIICTRPNFLNIPKKFRKDISAGYVHPAFLKAIELPYIRKYCLPDKGQLWGRRDFSQQELRIVAHAEDGPMMQGFLDSPSVRPCLKCGAPVGAKCVGGKFHRERDYDIHELVRAEAERLLRAAGLRDSFDRDSAKTVNFGFIYGQGTRGLMQSLKLTDAERDVALTIQRAIGVALPSLKKLNEEMKALFKSGQPLRTIGGRLYYCEEPKYSEAFGRDMEFSYKALNYYAQPGGADVTKAALVLYNDHPKRRGRLTVTVYDEINFSAPKAAMKEEMKILSWCMLNSLPCDVPLLSDGESGENWGTLTKWEE